MSKEIENIIAPPALEISSNYLRIGNKFAKTIFLFSYPRYLSAGWFSPIINLPNLLDISIFIHPLDSSMVLKKLRKKTAQIESQIQEGLEKGYVRNPMLETAYQDVEKLRDELQQSRENLFNVAVYLTIYAENIESLDKLESEINTFLEGRLVYAKPAGFQQLDGWTSTLPLGLDKLTISTPLNTSPISSFFPFVSANLTSEDGILYGVNTINNTLIIFDRFSLENANMVVFAKSGSGKSYATKLEALRQLMLGTSVIIIDPENEYEALANSVGGSFFRISLAGEQHINPFEIPVVPDDEDPADVLKSHIANLSGLVKVMIGVISPTEDALLDRAITETYASRDIVPGKDFTGITPPLLEDLEAVLRNIAGGESLAERLYKYTKGNYAGFTNQKTDIDLKNRLIVFSIRDLEEELRPTAVYIILNFIWNLIKSEKKKRILIIDEAWWMMKNPDSAQFLFSLVKRARKYYLGITTITQDVEDFLLSPYGRPIITNSSLQILLKQAPAMMDLITKTFNLSEAERNYLLEVPVGQGVFIAGLNHTTIQVVASYLEDQIVTTKPQ